MPSSRTSLPKTSPVGTHCKSVTHHPVPLSPSAVVGGPAETVAISPTQTHVSRPRASTTSPVRSALRHHHRRSKPSRGLHRRNSGNRVLYTIEGGVFIAKKKKNTNPVIVLHSSYLRKVAWLRMGRAGAHREAIAILDEVACFTLDWWRSVVCAAMALYGCENFFLHFHGRIRTL